VREKSGWLLGGILAVGFALRVIGIQFGLPHLYHADEPIVVNHALAFGTGDMNPHFFNIPPLVSYLLFFCYGVGYLAGRGAGFFQGVGDFEAAFLSDPSGFYLFARVAFGALLGTLSIYLLYEVVRKHFSKELALLTSFFFAVAFLHVRDSHYVYSDIPLLFVLIASMFPILRIVEGENRWKDNLAAGALLGVAVATKYNGIFIVVPFLVATLLTSKREKRILKWIAAGAVSVVMYSLLNPFTWFDFNFFIQEIREQAAAAGGGKWAHHLIYSLNGGVGPFLLATGLLGLAGGLLTRERKRLVIASFLVGYYLVLGFKSQPYDRYVLPLIPFLLIFSADFILALTQRVPRSLQRATLVFLACLVSFPSLGKAVLLDRVLSAQDVRTEAKGWVEQMIPPGSKLALDWEFYMPRLSFTKEQLQEKVEQVESNPHFSGSQKKRVNFLLSRKEWKEKVYELHFLSDQEENPFLFAAPSLPYDFEVLKEKGIEYVFIARLGEQHEHAEFYKALQEKGELVKRFTPYRDGQREYPFDAHALTGAPFLWKELVARERNGQPIEVFKLK
jgi:hypothetical protein